jgi:hypothetical protein
MDWEAIGAVGEVVGSITVVLSLLYLSSQVRQANRQSASDAGFSALSELNRTMDFVFSDPAGAGIIVKLKSNEALSDEEQVKVEVFADRAINSWYYAEISFRNGIMEEAIYLDVVEDSKRFLSIYPGLRKYCAVILEHYAVTKNMRMFTHVFDDVE